MHACAKQCAEEVLDVIPLVMRSIRAKIRIQPAPELSVPQFRALAFAGMNRGTTLSDLAEHLGLMPPAVSKMLDGLVAADLIERRTNTSDRRRIWLALTPVGRKKLQRAQRMARECLAEMLAPLDPTECAQISNVMQKLRKLF